MDNTFSMDSIDKDISETAEEGITEKLVDNEGNIVSEASSTDVHLKTDNFDNYIASNFAPSSVDTDRMSVLCRDSGVVDLEADNNDVSSEEGDIFADVVDSESIVQQENRHAVDQQCVIGTADYICVSDDMVDGCAVTACQIQGPSNVVICSSQCKDAVDNDSPDQGLEHDLEDGDNDYDEEEEFGTPEMRSPAVALDSFPGALQHPDCADTEDDEFTDGHRGFINPIFTNPGLKNNLEEDDSSLDSISTNSKQSVIPASLKEICLLQLIADHDKDSPFADQDTPVISADETDLKYSLEGADLHEVSSDETGEFKVPGGGCVRSRPASCDAADDLELPCSQEHVVAQTITGDSVKELPVVPLPTKHKSKGVGSLKKSLIKFGSFGKEHGNVKAKSKKDKDKTKTEAHGKHPKPEPESALRGHPSGSASQAVSGCVQQCEHTAARQNSSEASIQAQSSGSPSARQKRVFNPPAVDDAKLQRQNTWLIYQQALHEYKRRAEEHSKSPTESNKSAMDKQAAAIRRLKAQMDYAAQLNQSIGAEIMTSNFRHAPDLTSGVKVSSHDTSPDSACFMEERRDYLAGLPPSSNVLSSSLFQRHRKADSLSCPNRLEATKKESSLTRSHSDSFRKNRKEVDNLRQGNSSDDISNLKMLSARAAVLKRRVEGQGNSETDYSANSSDSAIDQISPVSEKGSTMAPVSLSSSSLNSRRDIIGFEDHECEDDEENINVQGGPFSDFDTLLHRPAHLAVFLNYLILNSDPSPLLFYLITESYPNGSLKEMRKWAYEIFSSFLVEKAPLKIRVDEQTVEFIHSTLQFRHDKEDIMRNIFSQLRIHLQLIINELLADFRTKQYLGLGSLFGDHHLTDNLDKAAQEKIIESSLWKHFTKSVENEDQERSAAMAAALAFVFKHFDYTNPEDHRLESCTAFNTKEKEKPKLSLFSKPSKKASLHAGHQLFLQQYFTKTYCVLCQNPLCGVGNQGFQCQKCGSNFHKGCLANVKEPCSGKKVQRSPTVVMEKPKPQVSNVFGSKNKLKMKLSSNSSVSSTSTAAAARERPTDECISRTESQTEEDVPSSNASHNRAWNKSDPPKSADDIKSSPIPSRSQNPADEGLPDDKVFIDSDATADLTKPSSLMRGNEAGHVSDEVTAGGYSLSESDLETETDLPSLESIIPKEHFKKIKPKEKKRQEVINELFYTECAHVRNLNVMYRIFYHPMMQAEHPPDFINLLFPNLRDMIEVHGNLNKDFKQKRKESENGIVGDFADLLVSHFSGEKGRRFQSVCATFCHKQSQALEALKQKQRKDPKLAALLQDAASNSLCRRLELKDFLPTAMQRLTKYPLLIENLLKYTQADSDEHQSLQLAHKSSKEILSHVNKAVQDYENQLKLVELQKKIDRRPIENSSNPVVVGFKNLDLMRHKLVYDGALTWRLSRDRLINLHVVLLEDLLLLLQKQDEKLVLRCQSTLITAGREDTKMTHSPIIRLSSVLIKPVATDKCAFFLISTSDVGAQIYDLVAGTKDEKNKWCKRLTDAIDAFKMAGAVKTNVPPSESTTVPAAELCKNAESFDVISHVQEPDVNKLSESVVYHEDTGHEILGDAIDEDSLQMDRQDIACAKGVARQKSSSLLSYLDEIQNLDEGIHQSLLQKRDILSKLGQLPEEDSDFILDLPLLPGPSENSDPKDVLVTMLRVSNCLVQHCNSLLKAEEPVTMPEAASEDVPPPLPARGPFLPSSDALPPPLPPRLYRTLQKPSPLQLTDYCVWMNNRLSYLMGYFLKAGVEKIRPVDLTPPSSQAPFSVHENEHEIEERPDEPVSTDSPNLLTYETDPVEDLTLCQEFPVEKLLEERESEAEIFDREDRDIGLESSDDFVVETCVITTVESVTTVTTVESVTTVADDVHPQDSEDHITICTETQFEGSSVIDTNDLSDGTQHSVDEALNVPVDSLEENTAT